MELYTIALMSTDSTGAYAYRGDDGKYVSISRNAEPAFVELDRTLFSAQLKRLGYGNHSNGDVCFVCSETVYAELSPSMRNDISKSDFTFVVGINELRVIRNHLPMEDSGRVTRIPFETLEECKSRIMVFLIHPDLENPVHTTLVTLGGGRVYSMMSPYNEVHNHMYKGEVGVGSERLCLEFPSVPDDFNNENDKYYQIEGVYQLHSQFDLGLSVLHIITEENNAN